MEVLRQRHFMRQRELGMVEEAFRSVTAGSAPFGLGFSGMAAARAFRGRLWGA